MSVHWVNFIKKCYIHVKLKFLKMRRPDRVFRIRGMKFNSSKTQATVLNQKKKRNSPSRSEMHLCLTWSRFSSVGELSLNDDGVEREMDRQSWAASAVMIQCCNELPLSGGLAIP